MKNNSYEEYQLWLEEKKEFIESLENEAPNLSTEFELEFYVLDVLSQLSKNNEKLDEDHDDVFYLGFDYLNYVYSSLELLAEHLYNNDLRLMDQYIDDILAYIYIDSLVLNVDMELSALEGEHDNELEKLDNLLEEAEQLLADKKGITPEFVETFEQEVTRILDEYEFDIYLDDILLFEYAEEHGLIEIEEE